MAEPYPGFSRGAPPPPGWSPGQALPVAQNAAAVSLPGLPTSYSSSFMGVNLFYPSWVPSYRTRGGIISMLFYGSLYAFVMFLILIVIHFTAFPIFSFSPDDNGFIPIPTVSDQQTAYIKAPAIPDLSANFLNVPACTYTVSTDLYLSGDFQASSVPRVILYRSASGNVSPPSTDTKDNLLTRFPDTNLLIWLDSIKNDLYVSIVTTSDGTAATSLLETTPAVENVPIRKVFRISVVFTQQFVEVYINGNLEKSMAVKKPPKTIADRSSFFPVISSIGPNVLISNLAFWPRALSAREVRAYGKPLTNETFYSKPAR
jgi:hypothetical protein